MKCRSNNFKIHNAYLNGRLGDGGADADEEAGAGWVHFATHDHGRVA